MDLNLSLIKVIERFPCLYNNNLPEFSRKEVTDRAWCEVARETKQDVATCKDKWRNLRYGLARSLKAKPGMERKQYYLHNSMAFVVPFMKTTQQADSPSTHNVAEEGIGQSPQFTDNEDSSMEPPEKKIRIEDPTSNENPVRNSEVVDDARKNFLLSLVPEVYEFTEKQMRSFRRKVLTLIDEIVVYA